MPINSSRRITTYNVKNRSIDQVVIAVLVDDVVVFDVIAVGFDTLNFKSRGIAQVVIAVKFNDGAVVDANIIIDFASS
jgi:hypothetical protein